MGQTGGNGGQGSYMCANPKGHGGLAINRKTADDFVAWSVWTRLVNADMENEEDREWVASAALRYAERSDLAGVQEERRETAARLQHVRQSIVELQADRKAGLYRGRDELATWRATMAQYREFGDECVARLADLDEKTASTVRIPAEWFAPGGNPLGPNSPWGHWDVYERRSFLELFLTGVSVGPGRDPETRKFINVEDRVQLDWRPLPQSEDEEEEEMATACV